MSKPYFIYFFCMPAAGLAWWCWLYHSKSFQSGKIMDIWLNSLMDIKSNWTGFLYFARPFVISSLILISIGNGSIRACVTSLGGSQFELPRQAKGLDQYFSHYYFIYTLGILLSKIVPPEIRAQTQCFGESECYAAVFGSLAAIFVVAWSECSD